MISSSWLRRLRHPHVGLELKSVLMLSILVAGVTIAAGYLYFNAARSALRNNDYCHAAWIGQALALSAQQDLLDRKSSALQGLASSSIRTGNVKLVALVDASGQVLACASQDCDEETLSTLTSIPVGLSSTTQADDQTLMLAQPVVFGKSAGHEDALVGAVRLVLDTSATAENLQKVRQRVQTIAGVLILSIVPLGYLMVHRILLQPVRRLLWAIRQFAAGDFTPRVATRRKDELGGLSQEFDAMADEIMRTRNELVSANERLERRAANHAQELRSLQGRLQQEITEKEGFLQALGGGLNEPLRRISTAAAAVLARRPEDMDAQVVQSIRGIAADADIQANLVSDLAELSRIRSCPQKREAVDIGHVIDELTRTFEPDLRQRGISLTVKSQMPMLYVERQRIVQMFWHLIDNAIKYMDRKCGGRIEIAYSLADDMHQFTVRDNGPGISPAQHESIFHVFRRGQDGPDCPPGKGLGLSLVRSIAANYEGKAWVQSEIGQGATFFVTLGLACTHMPQTDEPAG